MIHRGYSTKSIVQNIQIKSDHVIYVNYKARYNFPLHSSLQMFYHVQSYCYLCSYSEKHWGCFNFIELNRI